MISHPHGEEDGNNNAASMTSSGGNRRKDKKRYAPLQPFEVDVPVVDETPSASNHDNRHRQGHLRCTNQAILSVNVAVLCVLISIAVKLWTSSEYAACTLPSNCNEYEPKTTVKVLFEMPFAALFQELRGRKKFEASDVTVVGNYAYVVHDSLWAISRIDLSSLGMALSPNHVQIESRGNRPKKEESDYEAIFHHGGVLYAIRESIKFKKGEHSLVQPGYHAIIEELRINDGGDNGAEILTYSVIDACPSEFAFETDNKGLEGAVGMIDKQSGELYMLGLCEANDCRLSHQDRPGNGKIVVMQKFKTDGDDCVWRTIKLLSIPLTANFHDYSAIALAETGVVAITSQEDSKIWIGELLNTDSIKDIAFDNSVGHVYSYPVSLSNCSHIYCNVEGVHFLSGGLLIGVEDKMKSRGRQSYSCFEKDQSIHLFALP